MPKPKAKTAVEGEATLWLSSTPPSLNAVGSRGNPRAFHRAKKRLQLELELLLMGQGLLPRDCSRIVASAVLRFPVRRRRDEGNFRVLLEKALGDALTNGRWLPDDTPEHYRFERISFDPKPGSSRTLVTVRYVR